MSRGFGSTFGAGTTDIVRINYSSTILAVASFSCWYYVNGAGGANTGNLFRRDSGVTWAVAMNSSTTSMLFVPAFSTTSGNWSWTNAAGRWQHILLTYDGSSTANNPVVYLDGALVSVSRNTAPVGTFQGTASSTFIGNRTDGTRNFDGMVAHVVVWNGVTLSAGDAVALASGINPIIIGPGPQLLNLPLSGINNPESDFINGASLSMTGTRLGTSEPMVQPLIRLRRLVDYEANNVSAAYYPILARGFTEMPGGAREWTGM